MSVPKLVILSLTFLLVRLARGTDNLPILHPQCSENEDALNPTQLPYPNDCTKFYKCSGGFAFPMSCPRGLHWSVPTNRCEYPSAAGCDKSIVVPPTRTPSATARDNNEGVVTADCPIGENPSNPTQLAYPGDCGRFYKCEAGIAYPISCPTGLHWSTALNRCEWPNVANCAWSSQTSRPKPASPAPAPPTPAPPAPAPPAPAPPTPAPPAPAPPTPAPPAPPAPAPPTPAPPAPAPPTPAPPTPAPPTPAPPTPAPPTPAPAVSTPDPSVLSDLNAYCKSKVSQSGYLPYPGDCKRFIQCSYGRGYIQSCPGTLLFNSKLLACARTCV